MDPFSLSAVYLYVSTFGVAWFSGIFGTGGGMILLAVMTLFTPLDILVPLHGMLLIGNIVTRLMFHYRHIRWHYVGFCSLGLLLGTGIGAMLNVSISPAVFSICLGLVLLSFIWAPVKGEVKIPMFPAGVAHGVVASLFGTGGVLQAVFTRLPLTRHENIATFGMLMLILVCAKTVAFSSLGFAASSYIGVVVIAFFPAYLGSYFGKKSLDKISDRHFKILFRGMISFLAVRLVWQGAAVFLF